MSDNWDTPTADDGGFMGNNDYPSLDFPTLNTTHEGVVKAVKKRQDTKPDGTLVTWPNGDPKHVYLFELEDASGEMGTIWVRGNMVKAIREAVKAAGAGSPVGWHLKLQHHALGEPKPGFNPAKLYRAKITAAPARTAVTAEKEF